MLNIGEKIIQLKMQQNPSQSDLASKIGASRTIIGIYERNANTHSIEMLLKMARVFSVSVDFLIGEEQLCGYDKEVLKRMDDIEPRNKETNDKLFFLIADVVQNFKTRRAFAS